MPSFFFNDTATTEIYPLSLPTLFRSVPHPPRRVLGGAAGRRPGDPRGGAGDVRQVVRADAEHLRAPWIAEESGLQSAQAQTPRQRRGPPGLQGRSPGALQEVRPRGPAVEARVVGAPGGGADPRIGSSARARRLGIGAALLVV